MIGTGFMIAPAKRKSDRSVVKVSRKRPLSKKSKRLFAITDTGICSRTDAALLLVDGAFASRETRNASELSFGASHSPEIANRGPYHFSYPESSMVDVMLPALLNTDFTGHQVIQFSNGQNLDVRKAWKVDLGTGTISPIRLRALLAIYLQAEASRV
jgi:hypothetical protein